MHDIYTIGHSNHSFDDFAGLLKKHQVEVVIDVRSAPFSRFNPHFNKDELKRSLNDKKIRYLFLGRELGARSEDASCYLNGQVQFDKLAKTELFRNGADRVLNGAKRFTVALMCAEKDPLDCHRTILVARELVGRGAKVCHILADGSTRSHADVMKELRASLGLSEPDMFRDEIQLEQDAYEEQARKIAYKPSVNETDQA